MSNKKPILVFDVDGTICRETDDDGNLYHPLGVSYSDRPPYPFAVKAINDLYDQGYEIVLFTARYMHKENQSQLNSHSRGYSELVKWCEKWGINYSRLVFGKPSGQLYIDNHGFRLESEKGEKQWDGLREFLKDFKTTDYENAKLPLSV